MFLLLLETYKNKVLVYTSPFIFAASSCNIFGATLLVLTTTLPFDAYQPNQYDWIIAIG
jgi:hypothetical protein